MDDQPKKVSCPGVPPAANDLGQVDNVPGAKKKRFQFKNLIFTWPAIKKQTPYKVNLVKSFKLYKGFNYQMAVL